MEAVNWKALLVAEGVFLSEFEWCITRQNYQVFHLFRDVQKVKIGSLDFTKIATKNLLRIPQGIREQFA